MMEYLISMFIDDELDIDDKIEFVEKVHGDKVFQDEAVELLRQEKLIRSEVVDRVPSIKVQGKRRFAFFPLLRPVSLLASALAAAVIIFFLAMPTPKTTSTPYRFVIYQPDVRQAEITGSFTEWRKIPMKRIGSSGYFELSLYLPQGEHQFTYILEGSQRFPDPTIPTREQDDFGGENTVLLVEL
jgi:hypothetical protein